MTNIVKLPWPPKQLSPNARNDRRAISGIRAEYRELCGWVARAAKLRPGQELLICFAPPDRRKRDTDNVLASLKSGLDGVADAVGQDDSNWNPITIERGEPVKGGAVWIELRGTIS